MHEGPLFAQAAFAPGFLTQQFKNHSAFVKEETDKAAWSGKRQRLPHPVRPFVIGVEQAAARHRRRTCWRPWSTRRAKARSGARSPIGWPC